MNEKHFIVYVVTDDDLDFVQWKNSIGTILYDLFESFEELKEFEYVDGWSQADAQKIADVVGGEIMEVKK